MSERSKHLFQFRSDEIAKAAIREAKYHREREAYWRDEYAESLERVRATASVSVKEVPITGGTRPDVVVDHGDPAAYQRMYESFGKIQSHLKAAEEFETDSRTYQTQDRIYELDVSDVHFYRLGSPPRSE